MHPALMVAHLVNVCLVQAVVAWKLRRSRELGFLLIPVSAVASLIPTRVPVVN